MDFFDISTYFVIVFGLGVCAAFAIFKKNIEGYLKIDGTYLFLYSILIHTYFFDQLEILKKKKYLFYHIPIRTEG